MFIRRENFKQYITLYPVVSSIIALNLIIYLLTLIPGFGEDLIYAGMSVNALIAAGEWWRIITSMFIHAGFTHVLFNMFSLFLFGPELEKIAGKIRFLTIYFLAGIFGEAATYLTQDPYYASVGASGAIYGIFGAFAALVYYTRNLFPQLKQIILPLIVISVIMSFVTPNINIAAHLGGLVAGFILGIVYFNPKNMLRWRKKQIKRVK
ncbi:rhomboid family intramembrane serine protease [Lysinibacillus sp. 2017]|uniref:rhomboid family intramembrane serine protease n=1 Tax=unclassified Lysinibacillus TaxID=2636778 RepID=UPI000D528A05|nr:MULTISPECIES: rhomboid family intramembrane serine protease [unclassified Lysinibacillus]AWE08919.1 rhomboid family intramembrane serine protease [Lysinibacillus sp. 2017]TGN35570.1 rhomboid family intramembrane serine protease [Lysinibacillus sp. S2017]